MYQLKYWLTTLEPVLITSNVGDINMTCTQEYIPGTSILGVFAHKYITKNKPNNPHTDPNFRLWFLMGGLRFLNAYIMLSGEEDKKRCLPIPLSLQEAKNNPDDNIADILFEDLAEPRVIKRGFGEYENGNLICVEVKKILNFHHVRGNNRLKGHAAEGGIFNYESIAPQQTFQGLILGEKKELEEFVHTMESNEFIGRIGRSKSTQYGRVKIILDINIETFPGEAPLSTNIDNQRFSLTLLSHTIIYNENGLSSTEDEVLKRELAQVLSIDKSKVVIKKSFKKSADIENFISVWRLRKPSETAFQMGSCFLVELSDEIENLRDKLKTLERNGLGERRGEGFGRVAIGWQQKFGDYAQKAVPSEDIVKPEGPMPDILKQKLTEIMKRRIKQKIASLAYRDQKGFAMKSGLPSPSLISRLDLLFKNSNVKTHNDERRFIISLMNERQGLRKIARDKLKRVNNGKVSLWSFITDNYFLVPENGRLSKEIYLQIPASGQEGRLLAEINFPQNDRDFCAELYLVYWKTFFAFMRKAAQKEATHG